MPVLAGVLIAQADTDSKLIIVAGGHDTAWVESSVSEKRSSSVPYATTTK